MLECREGNVIPSALGLPQPKSEPSHVVGIATLDAQPVRKGSVTLQLLAVIIVGLMCGSELNIAVFGHPALNRQPLEVHIPVRSALAKQLGRVMPFWMSGSTLLNLLLVLPFEHPKSSVWRIDAIALTIQIVAVLFSLIALVPINTRIARWVPASLPGDWHAQEHLWDVYHWFRTSGLIAAFVLLAVGLAMR